MRSVRNFDRSGNPNQIAHQPTIEIADITRVTATHVDGIGPRRPSVRWRAGVPETNQFSRTRIFVRNQPCTQQHYLIIAKIVRRQSARDADVIITRCRWCCHALVNYCHGISPPSPPTPQHVSVPVCMCCVLSAHKYNSM